MVSCAGGWSICANGSGRNSGSASPSRPGVANCVPWVTASCPPDRVITPKPMAPSRILKKLPRGCGPARARQEDRSSRDRDLVCRRGACGTEEQDHPALGQARFATLGAARSTHRLNLYLRGHLPQGRQGRGPCIAPLQHHGEEPASGRDRDGSGAGCSRRAHPRPGRFAPVRQAHRAAEHHARPAAAQMPRTQPGRECLAVHPRQLALQPRVPLLRRHPRTLLLCLEQARRPAVDHYVDRIARLGTPVLINGTWYKYLITICRNDGSSSTTTIWPTSASMDALSTFLSLSCVVVIPGLARADRTLEIERRVSTAHFCSQQRAQHHHQCLDHGRRASSADEQADCFRLSHGTSCLVCHITTVNDRRVA